jgi:hypothetical protein
MKLYCEAMKLSTWDGCYDLKNIFTPKIGVLIQNKAKLFKNFIIILGFEKKTLHNVFA